jgi:hypothetical protein
MNDPTKTLLRPERPFPRPEGSIARGKAREAPEKSRARIEQVIRGRKRSFPLPKESMAAAKDF